MLFVAQDTGWTFASIDYSNIEVRAARISRRTRTPENLLEGDGDTTLSPPASVPQYADPTADV